jgi:endonuclease YncB( thermonuclease family)
MPQPTELTSPLRRRKVLRLLLWIGVGCIAISSLLDHAGAFRYCGNDLQRFDGKSVAVTNVLDGDTFCAKLQDQTDEVTIELLGVDAPELPAQHWAQRAHDYATARLLNRTVTLRLEPNCTRDADGHLLAYVYITDADLMNFDIVHDAQAYADRRMKCSMLGQFEQAENEARKKKRGLWKDLSDDQMPSWRREWLKQWRAEHPK